MGSKTRNSGSPLLEGIQNHLHDLRRRHVDHRRDVPGNGSDTHLGGVAGGAETGAEAGAEAGSGIDIMAEKICIVMHTRVNGIVRPARHLSMVVGVGAMMPIQMMISSEC